ncbi:MAG TPA: hypothetical protein VMZ06_18475 [Candidatus Bathyarchaeia archaeon]|nr:hypothetical protein [Candidatus Bathyarchaeia archaeon]
MAWRLVVILALVTGVCRAEELMWVDGAKPGETDYHVAFRGVFELEADAEVEIRTLGASWYVGWVDGAYAFEGPPRFPIAYPEYQMDRVNLKAGKHVLAVQVHHEGVSTRILDNVPPFFYCRVFSGGTELPVGWKCLRLDGYAPKVRRINAQLAWVEWCDTRQLPDGWRKLEFNDAPWASPAQANVSLGKIKPVSIGNVRLEKHPLAPMAEGPLAETFGYERDDIAARFFLRDLECRDLPPDGVWRRYDLGRVRLGRPLFTIDLPPGAVVEFASSESLAHGRVSPWITLSASDSCNLDHFVARGGVQEFFPLTPKGGRFIEVHVLALADHVKFVKEEYIERVYHGAPEGAFETNDDLLNRIWAVGIETYRACAEDALIDNPTRERGQWAGDVVSVGMDIAAAGYADMRLCRRALVQCAQSARPDGLVAGLCPGGAAYMSTYAAQWTSACIHYWELTGDIGLLHELYDAAVRNIGAFEKFRGPDGVSDEVGWGFVDWGYVRNEGPTDMGVNLHYLAAARDMMRWCKAIGNDDYGRYAAIEEEVAGLVRAWLEKNSSEGRPDWDRIGYHRTVLAMRLGMIAKKDERDGIEFVKRHILRCFPNDPAAPRLANPGMNQERLITPYFAHYAFPLLIERGEMDFVLGQYRTCWGWALGGGRTTWVEVFDTRWTHCHQWAGCPTWQLSRYVVGLRPRFDVAPDRYELNLVPGSLTEASGRVPMPAGGLIEVKWRRVDGTRIEYTLDCPVAVTLDIPTRDGTKTIQATGLTNIVLAQSEGAFFWEGQ